MIMLFRDTGRSRVWRVALVYIAMTLVVLYPVMAVEVPSFGDYLNHLAAMHIIAQIGHSDALQQYYQADWRPIPYQAMDVVFAGLNHIASIYNEGRIFLALCIVMPVVTTVLLHWAVHRRLSLVPAVMFLFCYNYLLAWGFLNYLLGICIAVLVFAGWVSTTAWPRWPRATLFCGLALVVYFSHLVAFGAYGLMLVGFELGLAFRSGFRPWRTIAADFAVVVLQAVVPLLLAVFSPAEHPFVGPMPTIYGDMAHKIIAIASPLLFAGNSVDFLAGALALPLFMCGLLTGHLRVAPALWPAIVPLAAVAVAMPNAVLGTFGMDFRLPTLLVMLLIGATSATVRTNRLTRSLILCAVLALAAVHAIGNLSRLQELDRQIADVRGVVSQMPRGSRLLIAQSPAAGQNEGSGLNHMSWHMGLVAVIDRDAFVPFLFTGIGMVRPVPALMASSTPNGLPLRMEALAEGFGRADTSGSDNSDGGGGRIYWRGWEHKFDYVLIQHEGHRPAWVPNNLRPIAVSDTADLYHIEPMTIH